MKTYKIPDAIDGLYKGAGLAVAAIKSGEIVDMFYVSDFLPEFDCEPENAISDPRLIVPVNSISSKGEVFFGMCGGREFTVL